MLRSYPLAEISARIGGNVYALAMFLTGVFVLYRRPDDGCAHCSWAGHHPRATTWSFGLRALDFVTSSDFWAASSDHQRCLLLFWAAVLFRAGFSPHRLVGGTGGAAYSLCAAIRDLQRWPELVASGALDWLSGLESGSEPDGLAYLLVSMLALVAIIAAAVRSARADQGGGLHSLSIPCWPCCCGAPQLFGGP
jgi:hypothetical protein